MMQKKNKLVAIVGGGPSGLTCIKTCLEEGFEPVCFEKTGDIGGLWRFRETNTEGVSSVMRSTIINSSKELSCFSDYPPPPNLPNFMHNRDLMTYMEGYADHFQLRPYIKLHSEITDIRQADNFIETGEWVVTVQNLKTNGDATSIKVGGVLVCVGHHSFPHQPEFPGLEEKFQGSVRHTHTHKDSKGFENHRTLVVGVGNSGGDAAVELSRVCSKVYLSTRSGTWIQNRVGFVGLPLDIIFVRRFGTFLMSHVFPFSFAQAFFRMLLNFRFDHAMYNIRPKHDPLSQHIMVNDELPNRIISGTVVVKGDVDRFTKNGVIFKGEELIEYPLDSVILATGYNIRFPFLDQNIVSVKKNEVTLYKYVFPPHLEKPTLAMIGLIQPLGSIMPISEMQVRWALRVFKGDCPLPSEKEMMDNIKQTRELMRMQFTESQRHTIQVEYISYMDDIACKIGAKPNLLRLFFTDPRLAFHVLFGACAPYQYRLQGPHPWSGARTAILSIDERVRAPFKTRFGTADEDKKRSSPGFKTMVLVTTCIIGIGAAVIELQTGVIGNFLRQYYNFNGE